MASHDSLQIPNIGDRFDRWEVISEPQLRPRGRQNSTMVLCRCDCGTEMWFRPVQLKTAHSCGCRQKEVASKTFTTHGKSGTKLHRLWRDMRSRCTTTTSTAYVNYGARGITVDPRWSDFLVFEAWILQQGWTPDLHFDLDRIDNDGPYSPENCRLVTRSQNLRNTRRNRRIEAFGEIKTMAGWVEDPRCVPSYATLWSRLQHGEEPESAITRPVGPQGRHRR